MARSNWNLFSNFEIVWNSFGILLDILSESLSNKLDTLSLILNLRNPYNARADRERARRTVPLFKCCSKRSGLFACRVYHADDMPIEPIGSIYKPICTNEYTQPICWLQAWTLFSLLSLELLERMEIFGVFSNTGKVSLSALYPE